MKTETNDKTRMIRMPLRFLQAACCLVALITVSAGFVKSSRNGYYSMLGSSAVTYTQLITYMGFLYALFLMLVVGVFNWFARPFRMFEVGSDFLMAVLLLIAAIILLCSDYVQNCGVYGNLLRCRSLNTAVVFTFISMALFLISMLVVLFMDRSDRSDHHNNLTGGVEAGHTIHHRDQYHANETPAARNSATARI